MNASRRKQIQDHVEECSEIVNAVIARHPAWTFDKVIPIAVAAIAALGATDAAEVMASRLERIDNTLSSIEQSGIGGR